MAGDLVFNATAYQRIDTSGLKPIKYDGPLFRVPPDQGQPPKIADNDPSNIYATLQKDGKTIATLYRSGLLQTPNDVALPSNLSRDGLGIPLANKRLQQLQAIYGGTVTYAQNASTASGASSAAVNSQKATAVPRVNVNASAILAQILGQFSSQT